MTDDVIRLREEIAEQKKALKRYERKWLRSMDLTFQDQQKLQKKQSSGCTLDTSSDQNSEWSCHEYRTCRYIP